MLEINFPLLSEKRKGFDLYPLIKIIEEKKIDRRINFIYNQIPKNNCQQCAKCCFSCAEVYFIEFINIARFLKSLPEDIQQKIIENCINYELLNLATLDYSCPFLDDKKCLIYSVRPIYSRMFGIYPESDYKGMIEGSRNQNSEIARFFCINYDIKLPEKVMTHDIKQCKNNENNEGELIALSEFERDRLHRQIVDIQHNTIPEEALPDIPRARYSYFFALFYFTIEELNSLQIQAVKEFLDLGKSPTADETIHSII